MVVPEITNEQVRWFHFRRSGLLVPFKSPEEAAQNLIGVQAQIPISADLALFNRVENVSLDFLKKTRDHDRRLVRMWGQRNTVHLYAAEDWPMLNLWVRDHSVVEAKLVKSDVKGMFRRLVRHTEKRLEKGERLTFKDVSSHNDFKSIIDAREKWMPLETATTFPDWLIAAAVIVRLVRDGVVCHGPDDGAESTFVHRHHWLPDLQWIEDEAYILSTGAKRYLGAYGPALPKNMAAFFGSTTKEVNRWIEAAGDQLTEVEVAGKKGFVQTDDLDALNEKPPSASKWPVHLLHRFDPYLLGTVGIKEKSWLIESDKIKKVWRPGGHIEPVILVSGRIAGTWRYTRKKTGLHFEMKPFNPMSQRILRGLKTKAKSIANFLEQDALKIEVY